MSNKPNISFKGSNGKIKLYDNYLRIDRETAMGFLTQGLKGKKDIKFKNISSIQIKKPGLTAGYIKFSIPGGNESKGGVFSAVKDENSITFKTKKKYKKALKIKEKIENKDSDSNTLSTSDEIEKLHNLLEKGALTKEEYQKEKKKILDN